jgi:2,3-bisphosphoglycerate-independent phosphoglycerate mutase
MEEKTSTLNIRQTGTYQYEVPVPETDATKTAPALDRALTIISHDILKHLTTHYLILVLADQHADRAVRDVDPQEHTQTDLEYQAALEAVQQGIALQLKRRERDLVFELSRPLTREQAA